MPWAVRLSYGGRPWARRASMLSRLALQSHARRVKGGAHVVAAAGVVVAGGEVMVVPVGAGGEGCEFSVQPRRDAARRCSQGSGCLSVGFCSVPQEPTRQTRRMTLHARRHAASALMLRHAHQTTSYDDVYLRSLSPASMPLSRGRLSSTQTKWYDTRSVSVRSSSQEQGNRAVGGLLGHAGPAIAAGEQNNGLMLFSTGAEGSRAEQWTTLDVDGVLQEPVRVRVDACVCLCWRWMHVLVLLASRE